MAKAPFLFYEKLKFNYLNRNFNKEPLSEAEFNLLSKTVKEIKLFVDTYGPHEFISRYEFDCKELDKELLQDKEEDKYNLKGIMGRTITVIEDHNKEFGPIRESAHTHVLESDLLNMVFYGISMLTPKNIQAYNQNELLLIQDLLKAVKENDVQGAEIALKKGADINLIFIEARCCDVGHSFIYLSDEYTLLAYAAKKQNLAMLQLFIDNNADINATYGEVNSDALMEAAKFSNFQIVETLLNNNININYTNINGTSALFFAIFSSYKMVELLIKYQADVNGFRNDVKYHSTPLMSAIELNHLPKNDIIKIIELLLKNGAKINDVNYNGKSALLKAVQGKNFEIVQILLKYGANTEITDNDGMNALHSAMDKKDYNIIRELLKYGAKINIDFTPDNKETINLIKDARAADLLLKNPEYDLSEFEISDSELLIGRLVNELKHDDSISNYSHYIYNLKNNNRINDELKNKIIESLDNAKQPLINQEQVYEIEDVDQSEDLLLNACNETCYDNGVGTIGEAP